jgi:hypothetical protein
MLKMTSKYEIAAYYFPNFHIDPLNEAWHGKGWTEWELVKYARPRFEGHQQPKVPLWGYDDESKPEGAEMRIGAAADHGITAFIYDWYWYEDGPFLERALEEGFLKARNNDRLKFSIMWANHDWLDMQPALRNRPFNVLRKGAVDPSVFMKATNHMIEKYFSHPSYWRVDGGLYLSVFEIVNLIKSFGTIEHTRAALDDFRNRVRAAGLGELHLNATLWEQYWGEPVWINGVKADEPEILEWLGFDSVTEYNWGINRQMPDFPKTSYAEYRDLSIGDFEKYSRKYSMPFYPHVSVGWDVSPRSTQTDVYENVGYPYMPILDGSTPKEFKKALLDTKKYLDSSLTRKKLLTINAWNEWTEGSYLEPDTVNGMGYLEAIKDVFL